MSKWYYIGFAAVFCTWIAESAYDSYNVSNCRIVAIRAGKSVDDIAKICKEQ